VPCNGSGLKHDIMDITRLRALRGPNLWSRHTCIEAIVSCTGEHCSLDTLPGFAERLRALFPGIRQLRPTTRSGPLSMADALELAALGLQASAGCPVTFSRTMQTDPGVYQVVVQYTEEAVGRLAFTLAEQLCRAAAEGGSSTSPVRCISCANSTRTSASARAPVPSSTPRSRAAFPSAA
jgi:cyanophycin synthetase